MEITKLLRGPRLELCSCLARLRAHLHSACVPHQAAKVGPRGTQRPPRGGSSATCRGTMSFRTCGAREWMEDCSVKVMDLHRKSMKNLFKIILFHDFPMCIGKSGCRSNSSPKFCAGLVHNAGTRRSRSLWSDPSLFFQPSTCKVFLRP